MILSLVGWRLAGVAGLAVATAATVIPTSVLALAAGRFYHGPAAAGLSMAVEPGWCRSRSGSSWRAVSILARAADHDG